MKIEYRRGSGRGRGEREEERGGARGVYRSVLLPDNLGLIAGSQFGPQSSAQIPYIGNIFRAPIQSCIELPSIAYSDR